MLLRRYFAARPSGKGTMPQRRLWRQPFNDSGVDFIEDNASDEQ